MKDGIYFNLSEKEYHNIEALTLSNSSMKMILSSPLEFWWQSNLNTLYEKEDKKCLSDGRSFHCLLLEGEKAFNERYSVVPEVIDQYSKNSNSYKNWVALQKDKEIISRKDYQLMKRIYDYLHYDEQLFDNNIIANGYPEVSIIWTEEDGIQRKARLDYLKQNCIIDLKTYIKTKDIDVNTFISQYFFKHKVFMQLIYYRRALLYAVKNFKDSQVYGNEKQKAFFNEMRSQEDFMLLVAFVNRELPQFRLRVFGKAECPDLWNLGEKNIELATKIYKDNLEKFGKNHIWMEDVDTNLQFTDIDFPQSFYEILGESNNG